MKLVTFINESYVPIVRNFDLQLKKCNIKEEFVIYCTNKPTYDLLIDSKIDREIHLSKIDLGTTSFSKPINKNIPLDVMTKQYSTINIVKHHLVYKELQENIYDPTRDWHNGSGMFLLVDTDMILFDNFIPDLVSLIRERHKERPFQGKPANFAFKYYLNFNRKNNGIGNTGARSIINTGFMVFNANQHSTIEITKEYINNLDTYVVTDKSANIDEFLITNFFDKNHQNIAHIPDHIHMVSCKSKIYQPDDIEWLKTKTKSFHLTFTRDKIGFMKRAGHWYL